MIIIRTKRNTIQFMTQTEFIVVAVIFNADDRCFWLNTTQFMTQTELIVVIFNTDNKYYLQKTIWVVVYT